MENLKKQRIALNLTQSELAELFGVSSTTVARWERGEIKPDAPGMLALAMEALETRALLDDPQLIKKMEMVKAKVANPLAEVKQRVKHPRVR